MAIYEPSDDDKLRRCPVVVLKHLTAEQYVDFCAFLVCIWKHIIC